MQKVETSIGESLRPVVLYFEDLEQLLSIFLEASTEVIIQTKTHRLEHLDELLQLSTPEINQLKIQIRNPYVSLSLSPNQVWLYASDDSPGQRGLFEKIKTLLRRRERRTARLESPVFQGALLGLATSGLGASIGKGAWRVAVSLGVGIFLVSVWSIHTHRTRFNRFSIIRLRRRSESPSFISRNADSILLSVISALLGGVIAFAISWLVK